MRRSLLCLLGAVLLLTGCTPMDSTAVPAPREVVVAYQSDLGLIPAIDGISLVLQAQPLEGLRGGEADIAVLRGPVPEGFSGFLLRRDEVILLQGYLDEPLALHRAEAELLAGKLERPGQVGAGALAVGRLRDLRPGWRAIPVDGVAPTPATVWNGSYPLSWPVSVVYRSDAEEPVLRAAAHLQAQADEPPPAWARLTVAGDFMLGRGVARAMREHGTLYPVAKVSEHLSSADLAFANLESPIGVKGAPLPGKQIWFRAAPEAVDLLTAAGLDGVAVANNHILDYDTENFLETLEYLEQAGIGYVGGGRSITEARQPLLLSAQGVKVAFLSYSEFADLFFDWSYPRAFAATDTVPGVAGIDDGWLAEDIRAARAQADLVAIAFHWGDEFQNYPNAEQQRLARLAIDLGADLVLGYHPHAIQGFELYRGGFIAYSTGNFIMDRQDTDLARESMLLDFYISPAGIHGVEVHPVWIRAEQPYVMAGAEGEALRQKMRAISGWE